MTRATLKYEARHAKMGLCDNLERQGGHGGDRVGAVFRMEGTHVYLGPIHTHVWQKPSQYCNYPPIKINKLIKNRIHSFSF